VVTDGLSYSGQWLVNFAPILALVVGVMVFGLIVTIIVNSKR
jgi:hypothetical protein